MEGEVDPQLQNKFESAQHKAQDVLNAFRTEIRQMMQELRSNKSGASRISRASRASNLVEAAAELAEQKTLKYLHIKAEQNAKLAQIKAAKELEIARARVDDLSGVGRGSDIDIGDDPKPEEIDEDYFVNKYLSDHQDSGANEVSLHDSLVQTLCKQLNLFRLPAPEPGVFTGDPLHYPSWKKTCHTLISTRAIPDEERLHYLKKYQGGDAKSCVESYFLLATPNAYGDACKLLDSRFGDSYTLAKAFRDKLEKWPKVAPRNSPALRKFVDFLKQCETGMQSIPSLSFLNDDFERRRILSKLPDWLVTRWSRLASTWRKKNGKPPPFSEFVSFLTDEADPVLSLRSLTAVSNVSNTPATKEKGHSNLVATKRPGCFLCKGNHPTRFCKELSKKNDDEKRKFVMTNVYVGAVCVANITFGTANQFFCSTCKGKHASVLHGITMMVPHNNDTNANQKNQSNQAITRRANGAQQSNKISSGG